MFTIEEITLMKMYCKENEPPEKEKILENLNDVIDCIEDIEMKELVKTTIRKLTAISGKDFEKIEFELALGE